MQADTQAAVTITPMIDRDDSPIMLLTESAAKCRVLIVDDDELVLRRLAALLRHAGYETHTATSGAAALQLLESTPCQIVLTDWLMPDMDGLMLCGRLRALRDVGYIYIVLLTVCSGRDEIVAGLAAGADDYVVKGSTSEELLARLAVGRRITQLERSLRASNLENRRMAATDALTGARSRRFLMQYLPRELERARRSDRPLAILCCDIDHFKTVNDTFGHAAGDEVLQEFVQRAERCIRTATDWVARSGGEEFVLVLPETDLHEASSVADRLRRAFSAETIATCAGPLTVTVSTGVSALEPGHNRSDASVLDLLRAADRGLYASKRLGRNRTTTMAVSCARLESYALPGATFEAG